MAGLHVPAWKRLGLELSNERLLQDVPRESTTSVVSRGHTRPDFPDENARKKLKSGSHVREKSNGLGIHVKQHDLSLGLDTSKKKVAFAEATKPPNEDTTQAANSTPPSSTTNDVKKPKSRPKSKPKKQSQPSQNKPHNGLVYLDQFYHNPRLWKFNKNRQVWVLKHALDETAIPKKHTFALACYIFGMGSGDARKRLANDVEKVVEAELNGKDKAKAKGQTKKTLVQRDDDDEHDDDDDDDDDDDKSVDSEGYKRFHNPKFNEMVKLIEAFSQDKKNIPDDESPLITWTNRQKRADVLWWTLSNKSASLDEPLFRRNYAASESESEDSSEDEDTTPAKPASLLSKAIPLASVHDASATKPAHRVRKSKQRTIVTEVSESSSSPSDSSSLSESSSSSDSDSD